MARRNRFIREEAESPHVISDLPLPLVKFIGRFATRCTLDCCSFGALELLPPAPGDGRWTIRLPLETDLARLRAQIEGIEAQKFYFRQLNLHFDKARALEFFAWFETGLRELRSVDS